MRDRRENVINLFRGILQCTFKVFRATPLLRLARVRDHDNIPSDNIIILYL